MLWCNVVIVVVVLLLRWLCADDVMRAECYSLSTVCT
jgi:hypothetical protein